MVEGSHQRANSRPAWTRGGGQRVTFCAPACWVNSCIRRFDGQSGGGAMVLSFRPILVLCPTGAGHIYRPSCRSPVVRVHVQSSGCFCHGHISAAEGRTTPMEINRIRRAGFVSLLGALALAKLCASAAMADPAPILGGDIVLGRPVTGSINDAAPQ